MLETQQWLIQAMAKTEPWMRSKKQGYAARPGTGPAGETCRTCRFLARKSMASTYRKCFLMVKAWTGGEKTDILAGAPACSKWLPVHSEIPGKHQRKFWAKDGMMMAMKHPLA